MNYSKLYTVYQPICSLEDEKIIGFEAFIRGPVSPRRLFERADQKNEIIKLDHFARELAIKTLKSLRSHQKLFINCHPRSLIKNKIFSEKVWTDIQPNQVVLEITEHEGIHDIRSTQSTLESVRELGIELALDDFGTGYSNLDLLEIVKPNYIKLDKRLTQHITNNLPVQKTISGIVKIAADLNIAVIAEGIEKTDQKEMLLSTGINLGQGWLLGRPVLAHETNSEGIQIYLSQAKIKNKVY